MIRSLSLTVVAAAFLAVGCDRPETSAETEELRRKIEELKKERRPPASRPDGELAAELREARQQLQMALVALEAEQAKNGNEDVVADAEELGVEELNLEGVPRAVVVEEGEGLEVAVDPIEPVAALLDANDHQVFFAELGKFGEWFETEDFGFVWQPNEIKQDPLWRPYTHGRWVHSDQGWTWISEEPFGWAVYHYGRWALLDQYGWVWIPGDDWAPAWVAWRKNDDFIGWAPLPPETLYDDDYSYDSGIDLSYGIGADYYNFVPTEYFYDPVFSHFEPRPRVHQLWLSTANVTRFSTRNGRVHCGGPDFGWVNRHVRSRVPSCRLDLAGGRDRFHGRARPRFEGNRLEIFAPRVDAPWNSAVCPSRVAGHLGRVSVARGKGRLDRTVVRSHQQAMVRRHERARAAMQTKECQDALRHNLVRRAEGRREGGRARSTQRLAQSEQTLQSARDTSEAAQRRLGEGNLNPKQRGYAERAARNAGQDLEAAREARAAALDANATAANEQEPRRDRREGEGRPVRQRQAAPAGEQARRPQDGEPQNEAALAKAGDESSAARSRVTRTELNPKQRVNGERGARDAAAQRQAAREAAGVQDDRERRAAEAQAEEDRRADLQQQRQQEEAVAAARARADAEGEASRRRGAQQNSNVREKASARRAAENAEKQRRATEQAAAAVAERRVQEQAERQRESEEKAQVAERQRQATAEQARRAQQAEFARESARKAERQRQRADSDRQRRAAEARQAAQEEAEQRAAAQQAQQAKQEAAARRKESESRRQEQAQREAEQARRQAAAEASRRASEARAQAQAQQQAREARRQAEAAAQQRAARDAQRQAAAQQRQQESQRRAAEARQQAEGARRQQAEASRRQQAEAARQRQQQDSARQRQQQQQQKQQQQRGSGRGRRK